MLRSIQWAALGTGFTFLMTTLGAAVVFFPDRGAKAPVSKRPRWALQPV